MPLCARMAAFRFSGAYEVVMRTWCASVRIGSNSAMRKGLAAACRTAVVEGAVGDGEPDHVVRGVGGPHLVHDRAQPLQVVVGPPLRREAGDADLDDPAGLQTCSASRPRCLPRGRPAGEQLGVERGPLLGRVHERPSAVLDAQDALVAQHLDGFAQVSR
jgi:hypothetical protein